MKIDTLILSGGGIKCYTFLGSLKYMIDKNIISEDLKGIKTVIGCSGGSLFILPLLLGYSINVTIQLLLKYNISNVTNISDFSFKDLLSQYGFFPNEFLENIIHLLLLHKKLPIDITLKQLYEYNQIDFISKVVNVSLNRVEYMNHISNPDIPLTTVIRMTTCIPFVFRPIKYNDCYYVDGAIRGGGFPIDRKRSKKYIGICIKNICSDKKEINSILDYISELAACTGEETEKNKYKKRIIRIEYQGHGCNFTENKKDKIMMVQKGYLSTKQHFQNLNSQKHNEPNQNHLHNPQYSNEVSP